MIHPFDETAADALKYVQEGWTVFQQFNCAHCGHQATIHRFRSLYTLGRAGECDQVTDIRKDGCNFMLIKGPK